MTLQSIPKGRPRLTQLLLFGANNTDTLKLSDVTLTDSLDWIGDLKVRHLGYTHLLQSDWDSYFALLIHSMSDSECPVCNISVNHLLSLIYKQKGRANQDVIKGLLTLRESYLSIEKNGNVTLSAPMFDYLSIHDNHIYYQINDSMREFWLAGEWSDQERFNRSRLARSELALWIYSLSQIFSTRIDLDTLRSISKTSDTKDYNFQLRIKSAIESVNALGLTKINLHIKRKNTNNISYLEFLKPESINN